MKDVRDGMPRGCEYCGKTHDKDGDPIDLRPYGKNGAWICFDCGMAPDNKETTEEVFAAILKGNDIVITGDRPQSDVVN